MYWQTLNFGRYKNKTLPQVVLHDPEYFFSGIKARVFKDRGFDMQAWHLDHRARNIKIPRPYGEKWRVYYDFEPGTDIFQGFRFVHRVAVEGFDDPFKWQPPSNLDLSVAYRHIEMTRARRSVCSEISHSSILGTRMRTYLGSNVTSFLNAMTIFIERSCLCRACKMECRCNVLNYAIPLGSVTYASIFYDCRRGDTAGEIL